MIDFKDLLLPTKGNAAILCLLSNRNIKIYSPSLVIIIIITYSREIDASKIFKINQKMESSTLVSLTA